MKATNRVAGACALGAMLILAVALVGDFRTPWLCQTASAVFIAREVRGA